MPLRHLLFGFGGRIARLPFYGGLLIVSFAIAVGFVLLASAVTGLNYLDALGAPTPLTIAAVCLEALGAVLILGTSMWALLALQTKRLHDLGRSGSILWWVYGFLAALCLAYAMTSRIFSPIQTSPVLMLIGFFSAAFMLWLVFTPGQPEQLSDHARIGPQGALK